MLSVVITEHLLGEEHGWNHDFLWQPLSGQFHGQSSNPGRANCRWVCGTLALIQMC